MSDHAPINLSCDMQDWGPAPYRFQAMCLHNTDLLELMQQWWATYSFHGSAGFILSKKLQALKIDIKTWEREVFGKVDRQIESIISELAVLDDLADKKLISTFQESKRLNLKQEFETIADRRHIMMLQKSGNSWDLDGDRNTKFYHRIVKMRRRNNTIHSLNINGHLTDNKELIKSSITDYFSSLFTERSSPRPSIANMKFKKLCSESAAGFESPISEVECLAALKGLGQDKTPGPDGFQVTIIRKC